MADAPKSLWRISNFPSLDGVGGLLAPGRWHNAGRLILYAAETPAGALLEIIARLDFDDLPDDDQLIEIVGFGKASIETVEEESLPDNWRADLGTTRKIGDDWLTSGRSLLLRAPSALAPLTSNWLINPRHEDVSTTSIARTMHFPLDGKLLRR